MPCFVFARTQVWQFGGIQFPSKRDPPGRNDNFLNRFGLYLSHFDFGFSDKEDEWNRAGEILKDITAGGFLIPVTFFLLSIGLQLGSGCVCPSADSDNRQKACMDFSLSGNGADGMAPHCILFFFSY